MQIKKILIIIKEKFFLFSHLKLTALEKKTVKKYQFLKFDYKKKNIFFEIVPDYYYLCYYNVLFNDHRFKNYNKIGIWTYFLPTQNKTNFIIFILRRIYQIFYYFFFKKKWINLYKTVGFSRCENIATAEFFFKKKKNYIINNKKKFLDLKLKNILVGDLIYDTYLRFRNYPTITFKDEFLSYLLTKSYEIINNLNKLYINYKPKIYFTGYASYIHHGLPARFFLTKNIKVFSGKNNIQLNKKITKSHFSHHPDHKLFQDNYNKKKIDAKKKIIKISKKNVKSKYNQNYENIPEYLKLNPYQSNKKLEKEYFNKLKNIQGVLFLQNFYDAPHSWGKMIFPDFYTWCVYTLNLIRKYKLPIAIKPHPNESFFVNTMKMPNLINRFKKRYKDLIWLDHRLNNKFIFRFIKFGISASGSILFELSLFNKIAISCGDHPGKYFNFTYEAKNHSEYKNLLLNFKKLKNKKTNLEQLHIFNYMYNLDYRSTINFKNQELEKFLMINKTFKIEDLIHIKKLI